VRRPQVREFLEDVGVRLKACGRALIFRQERQAVFDHVIGEANAAHPLALLGVRHGRPRSRRASEKFDELAPPHSSNSSALASNDCGTMRFSALAVLRLITADGRRTLLQKLQPLSTNRKLKIREAGDVALRPR
jgi:hypothetical protein